MNVVIAMALAIKFKIVTLSAGALGLYVTVSRPDFKHSIISSFFFCEDILQLHTFAWSLSLFGLRFLFKPKTDHVIFLILSSRLPFASLKRILKILPTGCSSSLLRISVIILEPVFKDSFPKAFAPHYKRGLTKRKSPLRKDPIPFPLCILKHALYTGPMSPKPL